MDAEQLNSLACRVLDKVKTHHKVFATTLTNLQNEVAALREENAGGQEVRIRGARSPGG